MKDEQSKYISHKMVDKTGDSREIGLNGVDGKILTGRAKSTKEHKENKEDEKAERRR